MEPRDLRKKTGGSRATRSARSAAGPRSAGSSAAPRLQLRPLGVRTSSKVRASAVAYLDAVFQSFASLNVLPRSRYEPWVRVGYDYEGLIAMAHEGPLVNAIQEGIPGRFARPAGDPHYESASSWAFSLLEASIAAATTSGEPYSSSSASITRCVEEFIASLTRVPRTRVAMIVSDIDLGKDRTNAAASFVEVNGVRFTPVGNNAESTLERLLPGSGYLVDRLDAFAFPGETAVAWCDESGWGRGLSDGSRSSTRIHRVLTAFRLLTGTTAHGLAVAYGSPVSVAPWSPIVRPLRHAGALRMTYRGLVLEPGFVEAAERSLRADLGRLMDLNVEESDLAFAIGRLNRAAGDYGLSLLDRIVELSIALEAALGGPERSDVGFRLRSRAATLLGDETDPEEAIFDTVRTLYDLRSRVVHGDPEVVKQLVKSVGKVKTSVRSELQGEQLQLVYDRFFDLVRRSITARIALGSGTRPFWPLTGRGPDIDRMLVNPGDRTRLKEQIGRYWTVRGLECAIRPATPTSGLLIP